MPSFSVNIPYEYPISPVHATCAARPLFIPSPQRYLAKHASCAEPHYATLRYATLRASHPAVNCYPFGAHKQQHECCCIYKSCANFHISYV